MRDRGRYLWNFGIATAATSVIVASRMAFAQAKDPPSPPPIESTQAGRSMATELSPEIKRMIDAARRLYETPGLILDRTAIDEAFDAQPKDTRHHTSTDGARSMGEVLIPRMGHEDPRWKIDLSYFEYPASSSWSVRVRFDISHGDKCYSSRLVEAYWGQVFVYRPLGTHALLRDLARPTDAPPIGPHDGEPYNADFHSQHAGSANVTFLLGTGGCLLEISASNLFKSKEYSNDNIYHQ